MMRSCLLPVVRRVSGSLRSLLGVVGLVLLGLVGLLRIAGWDADGGTVAARVARPAAPAASPTAPALCAATWLTIASPNVATRTNTLRALSTGPEDDLWAVGTFAVGPTLLGLTEHWDGTAWTVVPSPHTNPLGEVLTNVVRLAPNDVWAVGAHGAAPDLHPLALHWDGFAWQSVPLPAETPAGRLYGVAGVASTDVWAVGTPQNSADPPLLLHWDGRGWSRITLASPPPKTVLTAVAARATDDVWAVGSFTASNLRQFLVLHWDGTAWTSVPNLGLGELATVSIRAAADVWVGGQDTFSPTVLHWDGQSWSHWRLTNGPNSVRGVAPRAPNDVWAIAVGTLYHWDGLGWQEVAIPRPYLSGFLGMSQTVGATWIVGDYDLNTDIRQALVLRASSATWLPLATPPVTYGQRVSTLNAVTARTATDAWAVGSYAGTQSDFSLTLAEHWDGTAWSIVETPHISFGTQKLTGVTALTAADVWAVGYWVVAPFVAPAGPAPKQAAPPPPGEDRPAAPASAPAEYRLEILHWNGSTWTQVTAPNPGTAYQVLNAVAGVAANDVWAVGFTGSNQGEQTLILHWDGTAWASVPSPNGGGVRNELTGVVGLAANDVWAVGTTIDAVTRQALSLHWDGLTWQVVPVPNLGGNAVLWGVTARAANDVWAVGDFRPTSGGSTQTLVLHWNGTAWSPVPSPSVAGTDNTLSAVAQSTATDIWAVGSAGPTTNRQPLVLHWGGSAWTQVASGTVDGGAILRGVAARTANDVWAVGYRHPFDAGETLVSHYGNVLPFRDVVPTDPFYPYIRCLACRGLVSGYPDGTYRPANPTTRGQTAKIVANAAGYSEAIPPTQQTFADVPPGATFWLYVERVAAQGVLAGYPCGEPGEPCPGRYFRPSSDVTRAQMSKFTAESAGYTDPIPPTQQTFTDVPPSDALWVWVERTVGHGLVGGYPCGGAGEPCPGRYFRPTATLTRGQAAKFLAGAFFRNCPVPPQAP